MIEETLPLPAIPVSAGALIFDRKGRLLILKPTYKSGWTIPGGIMEADGESPWEACQREVREECGIEVRRGRLACMDFRRPKPGRAGGVLGVAGSVPGRRNPGLPAGGQGFRRIIQIAKPLQPVVGATSITGALEHNTDR